DQDFGDCDGNPGNGCEASLLTSNDHCGACESACVGGQTCEDGAGCSHHASQGSDGAFSPTSDTVLAAGVYHFTTITIPTGVTVRSDGNGALDLRATGNVTIGGTLDVRGGRGGDGKNGGNVNF